jgi:hypothetical protein
LTICKSAFSAGSSAFSAPKRWSALAAEKNRTDATAVALSWFAPSRRSVRAQGASPAAALAPLTSTRHTPAARLIVWRTGSLVPNPAERAPATARELLKGKATLNGPSPWISVCACSVSRNTLSLSSSGSAVGAVPSSSFRSSIHTPGVGLSVPMRRVKSASFAPGLKVFQMRRHCPSVRLAGARNCQSLPPIRLRTPGASDLTHALIV